MLTNAEQMAAYTRRQKERGYSRHTFFLPRDVMDYLRHLRGTGEAANLHDPLIDALRRTRGYQRFIAQQETEDSAS